MEFRPLPSQPPLFPPQAADYAQKALALSQEAANLCDLAYDVAYGADPQQRLDIYRPRTGHVRGVPVFIFMHGGGWTNGYKEWVGLLAPPIVAFPAVFVSIASRLAPDHRFPAPFDDCVAAIAWVYRNISTYGGDPEQIHIGGHASGGHLTSLATLRKDRLAQEGLPTSVIKGCYPVSARFNLVFDDPKPGTAEHRHQSVFFTPGQDARLASPYHQIGTNGTPFLLTYGDRDMPSVIEENQRMHAALTKNGVPVDLLVLEDHDHFDTALDLRHAAGPWMQRVHDALVGATAS